MTRARAPICVLAISAVSAGCAPDPVTGPTLAVTVVAEDLEAPVTCPATSCIVRGGQDALVVRATYDGVDIEELDSAAAPTAAVLANGVALEDPPTMSAIALTPRAFESETFLVPARAVARLGIRVTATQGYETNFEGIRVLAPTATLEGSCGSEPCQAGVGKATFTLSAWVAAETKASVSVWVDDVPRGIVAEPTLKAASSGPPTAVFALDVPDAGDSWEIRADVATTGAALVLDLQDDAEIVVDIPACGRTSCTMVAGDPIDLVVTAPKDIHAAEATIRALVDNVYTADVIVVPLDIVEGDTRTGVVEVTLPADGESVVYKAFVGPFSDSGPEVTLEEPEPMP
jgi:hypothetical protein